MKAKKIVNTMNTYQNYCDKIQKYTIRKTQLDGMEDEYGVLEMDKKINHTKKELGKFLDSEV